MFIKFRKGFILMPLMVPNASRIYYSLDFMFNMNGTTIATGARDPPVLFQLILSGQKRNCTSAAIHGPMSTQNHHPKYKISHHLLLNTMSKFSCLIFEKGRAPKVPSMSFDYWTKTSFPSS
ncbi:hypothetical protein SLE2022_378100 [Rubroshorea leprosula]